MDKKLECPDDRDKWRDTRRNILKSLGIGSAAAALPIVASGNGGQVDLPLRHNPVGSDTDHDRKLLSDDAHTRLGLSLYRYAWVVSPGNEPWSTNEITTGTSCWTGDEEDLDPGEPDQMQSDEYEDRIIENYTSIEYNDAVYQDGVISPNNENYLGGWEAVEYDPANTYEDFVEPATNVALALLPVHAAVSVALVSANMILQEVLSDYFEDSQKSERLWGWQNTSSGATGRSSTYWQWILECKEGAKLNLDYIASARTNAGGAIGTNMEPSIAFDWQETVPSVDDIEQEYSSSSSTMGLQSTVLSSSRASNNNNRSSRGEQMRTKNGNNVLKTNKEIIKNNPEQFKKDIALHQLDRIPDNKDIYLIEPDPEINEYNPEISDDVWQSTE